MHKFVGSWTLKSFELKSQEGRSHSKPFGDNPNGLIIYTKDGGMSVQMHREERALFEKQGYLAGTDSEIRTAFESYVAYYGIYEVNAEQKLITHHLQGSLIPNQSSSNLVRHFEFADSGATLHLKTDPMQVGDEQLVGILSWTKIS